MNKTTSGQNVPKAPDGRVLEPSGLFLMDGIEGLRSLPRHSVDMLLTDPPYGTTRNYWDVPLPLIEFWEAVRWAVKPDGAVLLFSQCPYDKVLGASNLAMLRHEWIWYKERGTGFLNANRAPLKKSENILVFYQKPPVYNPQFTYGEPYRKTHARSGSSPNYGKFEHIIANDLQTKEILEAHFLWSPEQHLEFQKKWITKEEFEKTDNLYIKTCWSFSNNRKAYIYSKACYEYKRRLHNAICFGNYKEFEDYCGIDLSEIDSYEDLNERRKAARRAILKALKPYSFKEEINSNTHIPKEIYDAILSGNKDWRNLQSVEATKQGKNVENMLCLTNLERTKQDDKCVKNMLYLQNLEFSKQSKHNKSLVVLENLQRTKQSKGLVSIISSENLERTKQGKSVERLQNLQSMEACKNSKSVESLAQQENLLRSKNITANNITITSVSYDEIDLPDPAETVIICDPPYRNTQGYQVEFDNDKFEQWCIDKAAEGYEVFVCEYNIENPAFEEVWSKEVINTGGGNKNQKKSIEKLYHVK